MVEVHSVGEVVANPDTGLEGDHFKKSSTVKRQLTLIQQEHLEVVPRILGIKEMPPELLRRNIVVSGINLLALKHQQFQVREVLLETTGVCAPCSRMEENLGAGGYNSMRGHGGITAKIIQGGQIQIGDTVRLALMS
jgi:MOSC domain-containing protein YiiM